MNAVPQFSVINFENGGLSVARPSDLQGPERGRAVIVFLSLSLNLYPLIYMSLRHGKAKIGM